MSQTWITLARDFHLPLVRNDIWVKLGHLRPERFSVCVKDLIIQYV